MLLSVAEARRRILAAVPRSPVTERVRVHEALGRVLAEPVTARGDVPPFANSAMDGWAVRASASGRLRIAGESRAGSPATVAVGDGEAIRISTGAALPEGAEAVVRVEDSREEGDEVVLALTAEAGRNVRVAGDDLRARAEVLLAGTTVGAAELAVAVAAGAAELEVAARPRVVVLCTGDELRPPGAELGPGEIHNSNGLALVAQAAEAGGAPSGPVLVPDDRARTEEALAAALVHGDVLAISGGVSVGPHDHVKPALESLGVEEVFWRVALQPGKPTWFGAREGRLVFGLPGNPVSAMVCFALFVRPALRALQGADPAPRRATARLTAVVRRNPEREQAVRVRLATGSDGTLHATPTGRQNSHLVSSLLGADGLALVAAGEDEAEEGELVEVESW